MNKKTSSEIIRMNAAGVKPSVIAERVGVSVNTVKSHIRRHSDDREKIPCLYCGRPVPQNPGRKQKKYCSDRCRMNYWNDRYKGQGLADGNS